MRSLRRRDFLRTILTAPRMRPVLRQSVVAIAAAIDSYVSAKACTYVDAEKATALDLRRNGSAHPNGIRECLKKVGKYRKGVFKDVDDARGCPRRQTVSDLTVIATRRNAIAHAGDLRPSGRKAPLRVDAVENHLRNAREIVIGLDQVLPDA